MSEMRSRVRSHPVFTLQGTKRSGVGALGEPTLQRVRGGGLQGNLGEGRLPCTWAPGERCLAAGQNFHSLVLRHYGVTWLGERTLKQQPKIFRYRVASYRVTWLKIGQIAGLKVYFLGGRVLEGAWFCPWRLACHPEQGRVWHSLPGNELPTL